MIQQTDLRSQEKGNQMNTLYWCLLTIGVIDFLIIALGSYMNFYLEELFLIPSVVYLFYILKQEKTKTAKSVLLLGIVMCIWFVIAQFIHHCMGLQTRPLGSFFSVYLIALTFATIVRDESKGLKIYMNIFFLGMLVIIFLFCVKIMGAVPEFLRAKLFYWKGGIILMIDPSQITGFLLAGIAAVLEIISLTKCMKKKACLLAIIFVLTLIVAMTKCYAGIWMMSLLLCAYSFLAIYKGGIIRFIVATTVALIVFGCTNLVTQKTIQWYDYKSGLKTRSILVVEDHDTCASINNVQFMEDTMFSRMIASNGRVSISAERGFAISASSEENSSTMNSMKRFSLRNTLDRFLPSLNGRKGLWLDIYDVLKKEPKTILLGTDYTNSFVLDRSGIDYAHSHNSWYDVLIALGLPGLFIVSVITAIAFWHIFIILFGKQYELWQKNIALLEICLMVLGALEPHLFLGGHYLAERNSLHPSDFTFFLCLGYMIQWRATDKASRKKLLEEATQEIVPVKE